ncbi:MAG: gliding motility-associated C-terminal domain-containing protein [candidate division WOR-3 bacterium]
MAATLAFCLLLITINPGSTWSGGGVIVDSPGLEIGPDQNDIMPAGEKRDYLFYVFLDRDTGSTVELSLPAAPSGWVFQLNDSTGSTSLIDTDGDGFPDLGFVPPANRQYFTLTIESPGQPAGDTSSLDAVTVVITGFLDTDSLVRDSARLTIRLIPSLSIHNFPNPLETQTTFVIGLPADGKISLFIFNRAGERICTLCQYEPCIAGVHRFIWNGTNDRNQPVASGTYHYLLEYHQGDRVQRIKKALVVNRQ